MANSRIHTGFWVDHSKHEVIGGTVTLKAEWGQNLISAATIVVQIIGMAVWVIAAYLIHQRRSVSGLRDEFDAQLQVLLRNCVSADGTAWDVFSLGQTWRGRRKEIWKTVAWISGLSAAIYAGFIVAGIFVAQIANNSYDSINVLMEPAACGFIDLNAGAAGNSGYNNVRINVSTNAQQYARSCYGGGSLASPISCSVYPVQSLNYTVETDGQSCPIPSDAACFTDDAEATPITLRTEVIDSHKHLGINAPIRDRLSVQYETTCAPLDYDFVDNFKATTTSTFNDTFFYPSVQNGTLEVYDLGPWNQSDFQSPYTFLYAPVVRNWGVGFLPYSMNAFSSYYPHKFENALWNPTAPFNQVSGDLSLIAIMPNSITFTNPVSDPMFRTFDRPDPALSGGAAYVPRRNVYLLACSEKWQICNVRNDKCTGWDTSLNLFNVPHWLQELDLNAVQNATFVRFASAMSVSTMNAAVYGVPSALLASYNLISQTGSQALPNGHWREEVEGWFQTVLAKWQFLPSVFPDVPLDVVRQNDLRFIPASDSGPEMKKQCHQQRVTAPQAYQSYNLFALVFIAFMGLLIPGVAVVVKSAHRFGIGKKHDHKYMSYQAEGLLQLHRMALENAGYDDWEEGVNVKPRTQMARKRLPQVALVREGTDREPMLRYPRAEHGGVEDNAEDSDASPKKGYQEVSKGDYE